MDNTANVADNPIVLTGELNPKSDSGLSTGTIDTTNVTQPDFFGTSEPLSTVTLSAALLPAGTPFIIGQVEAGSDGSWNIKSDVPLADGHYTITATAVDQFGKTTTTTPTVITSNLLIDTVGPVIDGMFFNRLNGQVDYIIKDPVDPDGSAPSGVWVNTLLDSSNYLLTKVHANKAYPGKWVVTDVTATPDPTIPYAYDVAVTFNGGAIFKGGFYLFTIRDSSNGNTLGAGPRREPSRRRVLRLVPLGQRHQRQRFRRRAPGVPQQGVRPSDHHRHCLRRQCRRRRPADRAGAQRDLRDGPPRRRQPDLLHNHQRRPMAPIPPPRTWPRRPRARPSSRSRTPPSRCSPPAAPSTRTWS